MIQTIHLEHAYVAGIFGGASIPRDAEQLVNGYVRASFSARRFGFVYRARATRRSMARIWMDVTYGSRPVTAQRQMVSTAGACRPAESRARRYARHPMPRASAFLCGLTVFAASSTGCTEGSQATTFQPPPAHAFSADVLEITLEVDYAAGAEPYTGGSGLLDEVWSLTRDNLSALFGGSNKTIRVPGDLSEMERIDVPPGPYSAPDLVDIESAHRQVYSQDPKVSFYVVWLDGYFEDAAGIQETVLGAALPDFGVVAMFKPAIRTAENPIAPAVAPFTEQSALVHELGHVLGLVDAGLPTVTDHADPDHPGHCNDPNCVMFWANEGARELRAFVTDVVATGDRVLFDAACLGDARARLGER